MKTGSHRLKGLPPVVSPGTRLLVLGSMPGARSLEEGRYYAQPRNRFWRVMEALTGQPAASDYDERKAALDRIGIGLWDVLAECERDGSLDHRIRAEVPNDFATFLADHPAIRTLAFNGQKAARSFDRLVRRRQPAIDRMGLRLLSLPSTSPANAAVGLDALVARWRVMVDHLP